MYSLTYAHHIHYIHRIHHIHLQSPADVSPLTSYQTQDPLAAIDLDSLEQIHYQTNITVI